MLGGEGERGMGTMVKRGDQAFTTVIVVNWNAKGLLEKCLASLVSQLEQPDEVLVVDNGSTDGSTDLVRRRYPRVQMLALADNVGFARANNLGIQSARGDYIALLNNDAEADPSWLGEMIAVLRANQGVGFCASKMLLWGQPSVADACGDFYTAEGVAGKIGHMLPAQSYDRPRQVFGASAGAAMYRREMLDDIGLFDEDFFMVHEDTDLSFRAQLGGYKCLYVPTATVYHRLSATIGRESDIHTYYGKRNIEFVYLKNMPTPLLLKFWALHVATELLLGAILMKRGKGRPYLIAKRDALRMMPRMLEKRKAIQRAARASPKEIDRILEKGWLTNALRRRLRGGVGGTGTPASQP